MCAITDGNGWYDTKQTKWRQPKSCVIDYFDRVIIQRQRGAVGEIYTNNTLHYASACTEAHCGAAALRRPQTRSENKTSVSGAVATGFDKRGYCANAGSGSTQFCICNHTIDGCLRESQLNFKRARNICKRSASTRVDGTPAWQRQRERWPDPWNEFNPHGWWARMEIANVWTLNTFLRDVNYSIRKIILFLG